MTAKPRLPKSALPMNGRTPVPTAVESNGGTGVGWDSQEAAPTPRT